MTKAYLEERLTNYQKNLADLDIQIQQLIANRNLVHGAMQELTILISEYNESIQPNKIEIIDIE
jgi:hypothetical protein